MPFFAEASFLSSIFSNEARANIDTSNFSPTVNNSQNMVLLEANVFSLALADKKDESVLEGEVNILSDNALVPATSPLGVSDGTEVGIGGSPYDQISVYVVRSGDTLSQIAKMFDISVDTVLSANDMKKGDKLQTGDVLLILPFSGIEHTVVKGQTLQSIAKLYKVDINEILISNDIELTTKLAIGDKLMIPDGVLLDSGSKPSGASSIARSTPSQGSLPNASGYFVNPVPSAKKTRGTSGTHKGVDLAAPTGTPILASAAGRVTFARNGYNGGFGNLVIISHANGTETLYAHQSSIATSVGAQVTQGQVIGYVGNTGNSRGAHLHFEVHKAKNPGNDWSWKR